MGNFSSYNQEKGNKNHLGQQKLSQFLQGGPKQNPTVVKYMHIHTHTHTHTHTSTIPQG